MYMGRKANPVASKLLADVEIKKKQEAHRKRLASMKPSLDTKPPPEHKHLYRNAKKEQLMEDRYARIEHENRLLLTKMSDIMTKKGGVDNVSSAWSYGRSLNRATRAKELRRITEDNLRILHRIQTVSPEYDHAKWEEDRLRQEKLVASICEFKKGSVVGDMPSARGRGGLGAGSSVMSSRSRSMGPTVGGGMGGMGSSSYGDEGGLGGGMGSGLMMSYGGAGASVADGGPIPGGIPGHGHSSHGHHMGGAAGAYPGGSAALSAYHAEAGLGLSGGMGGMGMGGMGMGGSMGGMGGMRGASAGGAMGGAGGAGGYGPAPSSALSGAGAMAMGGMGGYGR